MAIDYKRLGKEQFEIYILDEIEVGLKPTGGSRIELETLEKMRRNGVVFYKKKLIAAKSIIRNYIFPPPKERRE